MSAEIFLHLVETLLKLGRNVRCTVSREQLRVSMKEVIYCSSCMRDWSEVLNETEQLSNLEFFKTKKTGLLSLAKLLFGFKSWHENFKILLIKNYSDNAQWTLLNYFRQLKYFSKLLFSRPTSLQIAWMKLFIFLSYLRMLPFVKLQSLFCQYLPIFPRRDFPRSELCTKCRQEMYRNSLH